MSAFASSQQPASPINSSSSRSWRRNVIMQSINVFFNKRPKEQSAGTPPPTRNLSEWTSTTDNTVVISTDGANDQRKKQHGNATVNATISNVDTESSQPPSPDPEKTASTYKGKKDPFAGGFEGGVTYKSMKWWHAALAMVAETISLGILGLGHTLKVLGLIPGMFTILIVGAMATYAGYVVGQFKIRYPHIHSMGDAGQILAGRFGEELLGGGAVLFIVFIMGSHLVTGGHTFNVLTENAMCTVGFVGITGVISLVCTLPRTIKNTTWLSAASFASVILAVTIVMFDLGIRKPGLRVVDGQEPERFTLWGDPSSDFAAIIDALTTVMFAFAGHVAFFVFISELKDPRDFPKALAFLQASDISMYLISAVVIYVCGGGDVKSPALDSAGPIIRKVAWGIALPTVIIAGVINGHVAIKYVYVRMLRNRDDDLMHQKTWKARGIWYGLCLGFWGVAYLLAEAVPVFSMIISITGALFASWFTFGLPGMFWIHLNFKLERRGRFALRLVALQCWSRTKITLLVVNSLFVVSGAFIMIAGLYAVCMSIKANNKVNTTFSCLA